MSDRNNAPQIDVIANIARLKAMAAQLKAGKGIILVYFPIQQNSHLLHFEQKPLSLRLSLNKNE